MRRVYRRQTLNKVAVVYRTEDEERVIYVPREYWDTGVHNPGWASGGSSRRKKNSKRRGS
ncbi:MAG TPA: hypothetical protein VKA32_08580 [Gammaproteobacteria bacterium]|nr:hypothetical protein [Gammaproteobacteria bacterium]